jgi:hypothetical protein
MRRKGTNIMGKDINGRHQISISREDESHEYEISGAIRSQADLMTCMKHPAYKQSQHFRDQVRAAIIRGEQQGANVYACEVSTSGKPLSAPKQEDNSKARAMMMEAVREKFNDPRYKVSESYRQEVREWIKANDGVYEALNPESVTHRILSNGERHQVSIQSGEVGGPNTPSK